VIRLCSLVLSLSFFPITGGLRAAGFSPHHLITARMGKEKIMNETCVAIACRNASGMADLPLFVVKASPAEYALGIHYDRAEASAEAAGYERPFVCFDADEQKAILMAALRLARERNAAGN
jgi:hypothetical protein